MLPAILSRFTFHYTPQEAILPSMQRHNLLSLSGDSVFTIIRYKNLKRTCLENLKRNGSIEKSRVVLSIRISYPFSPLSRPEQHPRRTIDVFQQSLKEPVPAPKKINKAENARDRLLNKNSTEPEIPSASILQPANQVSPRVPQSTSMGICHRPERVLSFLLKCLGELLVSFDDRANSSFYSCQNNIITAFYFQMYRLLNKISGEPKIPSASILQPARPPSLSTNTICSFDIFASKSFAQAEPLLDNK
ncbi:hypothetical protein SADUNF_Sadunf04G0164600 [Salix dunnii]|uniref:Uncharacterized protein n=1 Tax=Salix dunnii TaxID=1413687 RepID=A0A835KC67_9ROSI|nr:hypothetical protein SADUNF_Sadunf04G0164600 [Salix dunnii]